MYATCRRTVLRREKFWEGVVATVQADSQIGGLEQGKKGQVHPGKGGGLNRVRGEGERGEVGKVMKQVLSLMALHLDHNLKGSIFKCNTIL